MIFSAQVAEISKKMIKIGEFCTIIAEKKQTFENKTAKMRTCLTKFSRLFECGAVFLSDSKGVIGFKRCNLIQKVQTCAFFVDLVKSFLNILFEQDSYSNEYLLAKFGVDTAENGPLKVCQILAKS